MILAQVPSCCCSLMSTRLESLAGLPDALELTFPGGLGPVAVGGTPQFLATWTPPSPHPQACFVRPHDPDRLPLRAVQGLEVTLSFL